MPHEARRRIRQIDLAILAVLVLGVLAIVIVSARDETNGAQAVEQATQ